MDTKIRTGRKWKEDIAIAIDSASAAVLLISANFLASDFVIEHELPPLLAAAEEDGAAICPVIVSPSRFMDTPSLAQFQSVNPPNRPLSALDFNAQEEVLLRVAEAVENALAGGEKTSRSGALQPVPADGAARPAEHTPARVMHGVPLPLPKVHRFRELRERFFVGRICIVADRGIILAATVNRESSAFIRERALH